MLDLPIQDACDFAVAQMANQGKQSICGISETCLYTDGEGNHCAIGWLLEEDEKEEVGDVELSAADLFAGKEFDIHVPYDEEEQGILSVLQDFHDAGYKKDRERHAYDLQDRGIDISGDQYQGWIDLGLERTV